MIWGALIGAALTYLKDKVADWTEGTSLEKYTHQWDNPKWYDYLGSGIGGGIGGGVGGMVGEAVRGINQYQDEPDEYDYRRSVGAVLGGLGKQWGSNNIASDDGTFYDDFLRKSLGKVGGLTNFLPDTRPQDPEVGDEEQIPSQSQPWQGIPYGSNQVPYTQWSPDV